MSFTPVDGSGPVRIQIPSQKSEKNNTAEKNNNPQFAAVLDDILKDDIPAFNLPELPASESQPPQKDTPVDSSKTDTSSQDPLKEVQAPTFPDMSHRVPAAETGISRAEPTPVTWSKAQLMNYRETGETGNYQPFVESSRGRTMWENRITVSMNLSEILHRHEALHDGSVHGNVTYADTQNLRAGIANSPEGQDVIRNAHQEHPEDQNKRYHVIRRALGELGLDNSNANFIAERTSRIPDYYEGKGNFVTKSMLAQSGYSPAGNPVLNASGEPTGVYNGGGYAYQTPDGGIGVFSNISTILNFMPKDTEIFEYHGRYSAGRPLDQPPKLGSPINVDRYMT